MSSKISRWIGSALVVAWVVLFVAISSAEAQIKYSQKGFVLMDYKVGGNISRDDKDFSKNESIDFGTQRFRIWNYWKLGEFANAEWMWEIDAILGVIGDSAGRRAQTNPLRGDVVKIETGIARLDVTIPTTDWHVRMGQQSFFTVLPQFQERVPGIKIYKAGGWIRPTIFFIPREKTLGSNVVKDQINDDQIVGAWLNTTPMKGLKFQPYFLWTNRKHVSLGTATENDFQRADFGFVSEYKAKGWYVNYLVVGQSGEQDFDDPTIKDRDIGAWAMEFGSGFDVGVNNFSFNFLYRRGQNSRNTGDITGWRPIVTFFANKNRMSQLLTSVNQHPTHDLEIATATGFANDPDAGIRSWGLWWKRPFNKQTRFELGFSVLQSDKKMDNDAVTTGGQEAGDDRHVGEAFDLLIVHKVTKGLTFNTGAAFLIPGDGLDEPNGTGGSSDADCCPWALFASAILRF